MSAYKHGVYIFEQPTSIVPPVRVGAAMPIVFGTAPVHKLIGTETGSVNDPTLCYSYNEAVEQFGFDSDYSSYTLCEFFKAYFALFNVAPIVVVNVFDPATHKTSVVAEIQTFADDEFALNHDGVVGSVTVKNQAGDTTYTIETDYEFDNITATISRVATGSITEGETVTVDYDYGDPSKVDTDDIIGGIDGTTGAPEGMELVNSVFPKFGMVPGQIVAPGWSHDPGVAAVMHSKASNINAHFKAIAVVDIDSNTVTQYTDVSATKNTNNLTDELLVVCWPKVKLGDEEFWMSSQVAGLIAQVDGDNEDIPYTSPSNKNFQMNAAVANGEEIWLGPEQANYLNGQGIITALNFVGGWKCWGNRTGCYPSVTDVKDAYLPIRRMFNWIGNTLVLTFWQKVDYPVNRRLIESIVDSANIWLNGLTARQFILGGRVEFQQDENSVTDLMDGIIKFHVYVTPPSPAREIDFILEYDPAYVETLFG
ncbi:MAG: phage tail sheath family protein [Desulfobacteraceae bacterium]|nr:phage tail sheath family protein [Desulfobacteraceae bacterium]